MIFRSQIYRSFLNSQSYAIRLESLEKTFREVTDQNEQTAYLRAMVINKLVSEVADGFMEHYQAIINGTFEGKMSDFLKPETAQAMKNCASEAIQSVYNHPSVTKVEITGYNVIGFLLNQFTEAFFKPDSEYNKKLLSLVPQQFNSPNATPYEKLRSVIDFISGMTDVYAVELYRQINGIEF